MGYLFRCLWSIAYGNAAAFWAYIGRVAKSQAASDAIVQMGGGGTAAGLTRNLALVKT